MPLEQNKNTREHDSNKWFDKKLVDKKITTFRRLKYIKETAMLSALGKDVTYKKFTYYPWAHNKFNKIFEPHNIVLTPQNKYCIKNLLNFNLKDHIPPEKNGLQKDIYRRETKKIWKLWYRTL